MITLEIEEYCNNCRGFIPKTYSGIEMDLEQVDTIIRCENYKNCRRIVRYLSKQIDKNIQNDLGEMKNDGSSGVETLNTSG